MKVHELITVLLTFPQMAEVLGTREGTRVPFEAYLASDGSAMMDTEDARFKMLHQSTQCEVCGMLASGRPWGDHAVCGKHWTKFNPGNWGLPPIEAFNKAFNGDTHESP